MSQPVPFENDLLDLLRTVIDPETGRGIVEAGFVREARRVGGVPSVQVELCSPTNPHRESIRADVEQRIPGAQVQFSWKVRRPVAVGTDKLVPQVKNVILVGSGKGGVGKSTVSVNLAVALAQAGAKVGLLDADIYGPSIPIMMGVPRARPQAVDGKKLLPVVAHGIELISIGFFVDPDQAMVWRGPMLHGALVQFFRDVQWSELDYLILDLPPGTGDIQLTIAQQVQVAGAVVVTTPQDVALADAIKAKTMFDKVDVPVLGLVENMSYFSCPHCDGRTDIFHHGGGRRAAEKLDIPFLGEVPLVLSIREGGDAGVPVMVARPESGEAQALRQVAARVASQVARAGMQGQGLVVGPTDPRQLVQIKL